MSNTPLNENAPYFVAMKGFERSLLLDALILNNWNIEAAGRTLGISGTHVRARMKHVGGIEELDPKRTKKAANARREDSDPAPEGNTPPPTVEPDSTDGETIPDDAEQAGHLDEGDQSVDGASDKSN